jgi:hypothetical protein
MVVPIQRPQCALGTKYAVYTPSIDLHLRGFANCDLFIIIDGFMKIRDRAR